ncbi:M48 family metallopeptidase [Halobacterium jilantaiense]|uniref:STE24 endopeptidase n=1 Tax=Halobacterium jilantaiense TaxID=355548 RepID=A0A1I0NTL5_9EURY|nr:M48 family metalloprotease [Halobacterium jilantaiense]SEW04972.1 STE24 endopeptidase [Halobacterium jilantaiense]
MHATALGVLPAVAYAVSRLTASLATRTPDRTLAATRLRRANRLLQVAVALAGVALATDSLLDDAVVAAVPGPTALGVLAGLAGTVVVGGVAPALAVHLGSRPAWAAVTRAAPDYGRAVRRYLLFVTVLTAPAFAVVGVWLAAPSGLPGLAAVALAALALAAGLPVLAARHAGVREPTERERACVPECARGLRVRVVDTSRSPVANALAAGALPGYRYVFVTDALFATLDDDAVAAVVAHEAGHHRRAHVAVRFLAVGGALAPVFLAAGGILPGVLAPAVASVVLLLAAGPVVRWTEFDADDYAARHTSPVAMERALATLAARGLLAEDRGRLVGLVSLHPSVDDRRGRLQDHNPH